MQRKKKVGTKQEKKQARATTCENDQMLDLTEKNFKVDFISMYVQRT